MKWQKFGHGKKSLFRRISEGIENNVPPLKLSWQFFLHPRQNSKFIPKFDVNIPSNVTDASMLMKDLVLKKEEGLKQFKPFVEELMKEVEIKSNLPETIEMVEERKSYPVVIPKLHIQRKEVKVPWLPVINVIRKTWTVPLPKIKWRMPLLKKLALTGVIIIFPLLLFSAGFLVYTIKDMYNNGFVNEVMRYKIDEKIKQEVDPLKANIQILQTTTGELEAQTSWINKYNIMNLKKLKRDNLIQKVKSSYMNNKGD